MENKSDYKVLFYTTIPRIFRTTLIGYLYEISQVYPVVLLSEELDSETEEILKNKTLFPKLEEIIPIRQFTGEKMNLFAKNKYLYNLAKDTVRRYNPDIIISPSDMHSLFELYLMRFGKRINSLKITIQSSNFGDSATEAKWVDLVNVHLRSPLFLPFWLRFFLIKSRKYFGHFLYHWILPLTVGEKPFLGKSSFILRKGNSGMRDADYQIVFSKRDYDIFLRDGVPAKKLYILAHPLARKTKEFFKKAYFNKFKKHKRDAKVISLILPEDTALGFKKEDFSLISKKEKEKTWIETIKLINKILSGWKIYVKPHPSTKNINKVKESFESISKDIEIVNSQELADKYIEISDAIVGLPLSVSTALFTASLQCSEKPILSLDFYQELLGDYYKNFDGIDYVENIEELTKILESIRDNKYQKQHRENKEEIGLRDFANTVELLDYLLKIKK